MGGKRVVKAETINGINMLLRGKTEGFNIIYQETYSYVWKRVMFLMKNVDDAMNLSQEVYFIVYTSIDSLDNANNLFDWLNTIIHNQIMQLYQTEDGVLSAKEQQGLFDFNKVFSTDTECLEEIEIIGFETNYDAIISRIESLNKKSTITENDGVKAVDETVKSDDISTHIGGLEKEKTKINTSKRIVVGVVAVLILLIGNSIVYKVIKDKPLKLVQTTTEMTMEERGSELHTEYDEDKEVGKENENSKNIKEVITLLSKAEYEAIVTEMKKAKAVDTEEKELLLSMANILLFSRLISDDGIVVPEMSNMDKLSFNYTLLNTGGWVKSKDVGVYDVNEAKEVFNDMYLAGDLPKNDGSMPWIQYPDDDTIIIQFAQGELGIGISGGQIRENENYYLVSAPYMGETHEGLSGELHGYVDVLFIKNPESQFKVSMVYAKTFQEEKLIVDIKASSELESTNEKNYYVSNLIDDDLSTAWVEGRDNLGVGETITIQLSKPTEVYGIVLYNGYLASRDLFDKNGKVTEMSVDFGQGSEITVSVSDELLYDTDLIDEFTCPIGRAQLDVPIITDRITITITDAIAGYKYDDVCVSEIKVY